MSRFGWCLIGAENHDRCITSFVSGEKKYECDCDCHEERRKR